ncbi:hypothetical protein FH972_026235 [Carpinus fangiana]|uniref:Uncharacterized protein n=1 Tax=Carpinus fangiana TaxID=176857 RepID=A0A5N6L3D0_9ROSI|nr:hypothetical protein FH972_026235 [Carpinus fangiana]
MGLHQQMVLLRAELVVSWCTGAKQLQVAGQIWVPSHLDPDVFCVVAVASYIIQGLPGEMKMVGLMQLKNITNILGSDRPSEAWSTEANADYIPPLH